MLLVYCSVDIDKLDAAVEQDPTLFDVSHIPDSHLIRESGKMTFLVKLLDNLKEEGHRCLVFSSSRRMLDIVEKVMRGRVSVLRLDVAV
jgi:SNF2 family DNA or RNA helicase